MSEYKSEDEQAILDQYTLIVWPPPWQFDTAKNLLEELNKEMSQRHILYGLEVRPIARRHDNDDVLFAALDKTKPPLVLVHLTYSGKEENPPLPHAVFFNTLKDLFELTD
jgi:hypothetical protein